MKSGFFTPDIFCEWAIQFSAWTVRKIKFNDQYETKKKKFYDQSEITLQIRWLTMCLTLYIIIGETCFLIGVSDWWKNVKFNDLYLFSFG